MNRFYKFLLIFLVFFIFNSCSFENKTGVWKNENDDLKTQQSEEENPIQPVFSKEKKFKKEVLNTTSIKISNSFTNDRWLEKDFTPNNHVPHLDYSNQKNLILKSKKIGKNKFKTSTVDYEPLILENNIFFYDTSGNIYSYSTEIEKLNWKFNFYKKKFKKIPITMGFKIDSNSLIVSDSLGYLYKLNTDSGKLIWAKNYGVPFKSNIKLKEQKVFLVNQDNKFYKIKASDGEKEFDIETFPSFLKSKQISNISVEGKNKTVFFITTSGELYSINYETNDLNWLFNISSIKRDKKLDLFFSSPIVLQNNRLFVSTSLSTISMDPIRGSVKWDLPFSTYIKPVVLNDLIFLISEDGFILSLNSETGKVIWSRELFKNKKKFNQKKTGEINSLMMIDDQIFITTEKGYFFFLNYQDGKIINYAKVAKGFFSKPTVANKKIYIIDKNMRVLIFN